MDFELLGYKIIEVIYQSEKTTVYRALKEAENKIYILKVSVDHTSNFKFKAIFEQEQRILDLLSQTSKEGIVKGRGLQEISNHSIIFLEDAGVSLQDYVDKNGPLNLDLFSTVAIKTAEILGHIHQHQIIHKDIKPANLMLSKDTNKITIIDFNISSMLSREKESLTSNKVLEGSLPFMSPEQTGRMNRDIDYRSDFYSLGQTFYTLLTGKLAFDSTDPMEIIHGHIAKAMPLIRNEKKEIPISLDKIIQKLCSKNAEDRYLTAYGLSYDLNKCFDESKRLGLDFDFELGEKDISNRFEIPQKLYGREDELNLLLNLFKKVSNGAVEMLLVKGLSGVGKSALISEVHRPMVEQHGHFMSGKFEQFKREIPYSSIKKAFSELSKQLLLLNDERLNELKEQVKTVIGRNMKVMVDFSNELIPIFGEYEEIEELPPQESMNRLNHIITNFFRIIAGKGHPLIIFIDDLQWADGASLELINMLMNAQEMKYLLFIGSYRDNEVDPRHPWSLILDDLKKSKLSITELMIQPLKKESIKNLLSDIFKRYKSDIDGLTENIYSKTSGNPFFVGEFLKTLYFEKIINFSTEEGTWHWDLTKINTLKISDNVVDLMIDKLKMLPPETQMNLQLGACIGAEFSLKTLSIISKKTQKETAKGLWRALCDGLIFSLGNDYKVIQGDLQQDFFEDVSENDFDTLKISYKFAHDRVQQASYALISQEAKEETHYKIAELLYNSLSEEDHELFLFDIVNHYNIAKKIIPIEKRQFLLLLNLKAGSKSISIQAFRPSLIYAETAMGLIQEDDFKTIRDDIILLYKLRVESEYLNHNTANAQEYADKALDLTTDPIDKAEIYLLLVIMYSLNNDHEMALIKGCKGLTYLGIYESPKCGKIRVAYIVLKEMWNLRNFDFNKFKSMPKMTNKKDILIATYSATMAPSGFLVQLELIFVLMMRTLTHCSKKGITDMISFLVECYGFVQMAAFFRLNKYKELINLGRELQKHFPNDSVRSRMAILESYLTGGLIFTPKEHQEISSDGVKKGITSGDFTYATFNAGASVLVGFYNGELLLNEINVIADKLIKVCSDTKVEDLEAYGNLVKINVEALRGKTKSLDDYTSDEKDGEALHQYYYDNYNRGFCSKVWSIRMTNSYLARNFKKVLQLKKSMKRYHMPQLQTTNLLGFMIATCLAMSEVYRSSNIFSKIIYKAKIFYFTSYLFAYSRLGNNHKCSYYLMKGTYQKAVKKNYKKSVRYLLQSIKFGKETKKHLYWGMAHEELSRVYFLQGNFADAGAELSNALNIYDNWGAYGKVKQIHEEFSLKRVTNEKNNIPSAKHSTITSTTQTISRTLTQGDTKEEFLDLNTALKVSQVLASVVKIDDLMTQMMKIMIHNAGAMRAFFIVPGSDDKDHQIIAKAVDDKISSSLNIDLISEANISHQLVKAILKTEKPIIIADISKEPEYLNDHYVQKMKPKSTMGFPIIHKQNLVGIIYLENNLSEGVFNEERISFLNVITSQLAISLENAELYENLEEKVKERTEELKQAQKKMIEMAQKSGMSDIASGILHNIGNILPSIKLMLHGLSEKNIKRETNILGQVVAIFEKNKNDYQTFLTKDEKGKKIIPFFKTFHQQMSDRSEYIETTTKKLTTDIMKIENIVFEQKKYTHTETFIEEVDLLAVFNEIKEKLQGTYSSDIKLEVLGSSNIFPITEKHKLSFALESLIRNAYESIMTKKVSSGIIKISFDHQNGEFIAIIEDNGIGLSDEVKKKLFSSGFTTKLDRFGMGLHNSFNFIYSMKGKIEAFSNGENSGAKFVIRFPAKLKDESNLKLVA